MKHNTHNKLITLIIPVLGCLIILLRNPILSLTSYLPGCFVYKYLHLYCPGCGNTRSITALLHGDLAASLRYNPIPILMLLLTVLAYLEYASTSFGKPIKLLPRKLWFYLVLIILMVIYFILRNISPYLAP